MKSTAILIPARYASTRFPGKPLTLLDGVPMIKRVYDTCVATGHDTYVLTDDWGIAQLFDDNACRLDSTDYQNGTERCAGAVRHIREYDQYINVQGDMPDVTVEMINRTERNLLMCDVVTAWTEMDPRLQADPNSVKLVHNNVYAHWFGRGFTYGAQHLGIYGYSSKALRRYRDVPSQYEIEEGLEQLRWFQLHQKIAVTRVDFNGIEINTPEDAERWNDSR